MQMNLFTKQKKFTDIETNFIVIKGDGGGREDTLEFGVNRYTLLHKIR